MGVGCLAQTGLLAPGIFDELAAAQLQGLELAHLFRRCGHSGRSSRSAISRITAASTRSVLASRPSEFAKARAQRGLIRIAETPAAASADAQRPLRARPMDLSRFDAAPVSLSDVSTHWTDLGV